MRKRLTTIVATVVTSLLLSASAWAGPATDRVRAKQSQLFEAVAKQKGHASDDKLKGLFDDILDYDAFARGSLGKKWGTLSAEQQQEFQGLLTRLVRNNYRRNLKRLLDYNVTYQGEEAKGAGVRVKTIAKHKTKKREPAIEVDFVLVKAGGKLKIIDIYTERASLVRTYRYQFLRILRKKGYDSLIAKMKKKLAKQER